MARLVVDRFDEGMADDRFSRSVGEFSVAKGFDILSLPNRLSPTRTTTTDTASTGIGNIIVGSDGVLYGLGADSGNPTTNSQLYKKVDNATNWAALSNEKTGSSALNFDLFVEYPDSGGARTVFCNGSAGIAMLDKSNVASVNTHSLTFTSLSQGLVHPKDDILYIPYTTSTGTFIASFNGATTTWNDTALTLPTALVVVGLSFYGNYLVIACAPRGAYTFASTGKTVANSANGGAFRSTVFLWDRDTSLATVSETLDWGTGILQVINNLNGKIIGISNVGGPTSNIADRNSIAIKEYDGSFPRQIKEISTQKQTTTVPSVNINPYVNFIFRNRLYFSIDIVGGSTSPKYYGLWAIGVSKETGRYATTIERGATSGDTETSVIAAGATGDYFSFVHTAAGTLGFSINNTSVAVSFAGTSYYESVVNPGMSQTKTTRHDQNVPKQLNAVAVGMVPLTSTGQVILKIRVDGGSWTTIATYTSSLAGGSDTVSRFERTKDASGASLPNGTYYEFRLESTGGAEITEFSYKYEVMETSITP